MFLQGGCSELQPVSAENDSLYSGIDTLGKDYSSIPSDSSFTGGALSFLLPAGTYPVENGSRNFNTDSIWFDAYEVSNSDYYDFLSNFSDSPPARSKYWINDSLLLEYLLQDSGSAAERPWQWGFDTAAVDSFSFWPDTALNYLSADTLDGKFVIRLENFYMLRNYAARRISSEQGSDTSSIDSVRISAAAYGRDDFFTGPASPSALRDSIESVSLKNGYSLSEYIDSVGTAMDSAEPDDNKEPYLNLIDTLYRDSGYFMGRSPYTDTISFASETEYENLFGTVIRLMDSLESRELIEDASFSLSDIVFTEAARRYPFMEFRQADSLIDSSAFDTLIYIQGGEDFSGYLHIFLDSVSGFGVSDGFYGFFVCLDVRRSDGSWFSGKSIFGNDENVESGYSFLSSRFDKAGVVTDAVDSITAGRTTGVYNFLDGGIPLSKYDDSPVTGISVYDAASYCESKGKRLPTADEWEAAAHGKDGRPYPFGDSDSLLSLMADWPVPSDSNKFDRSAFGIYHMTGNLMEWCTDSVSVSLSDSGEFPVMGGSFWGVRMPGSIHGELLKGRNRLYYKNGEERNIITGFRCVRDNK
ncbi:MAG: formylglycine-generating enzyme family protein [Fibrobacterota bacterium]